MTTLNKVYLTFDIETIVARYSANDNCYASISLAPLIIANELKKRNLKGTFFISLSPKTKSLSYCTYMGYLEILFQGLRGFENIKLAPHIHAYSLPLSFSPIKDGFDKYTLEQQIAMLKWARELLKKFEYEVDSFRPGGFLINDSYYKALEAAGYENSSILVKDETPVIDLLKNKLSSNSPYSVNNSILEYPVSSVKIKSIKGKEEIINLSPDFIVLDTVKKYLYKMDYININYHSFSLLLTRLIREDHNSIYWHNVKYLLFERTLNNMLKRFDIHTIYGNTVLRNELLNYLDFFSSEKSFCTKFIGEK